MLAVIVVGAVSGFTVSSALLPANRVTRSTSDVSMAFVTHFEQMSVDTGRTVSMVDITSRVADAVAKSGCKEGTVTVLAKHSTVGVMLNEFEERFVSDARQWLLKIAPPSYPCV